MIVKYSIKIAGYKKIINWKLNNNFLFNYILKIFLEM